MGSLIFLKVPWLCLYAVRTERAPMLISEISLKRLCLPCRGAKHAD